MEKKNQHGPERICVHLGAHKTATTYMQATFESIRSSRGGDYLGLLTPRGCRSMAGLTFHTFGRSVEEIDNIASISCKLLEEWMFSEVARGASWILLSDEQIMGSSRLNISSEVLYPGFGTRLRCIPKSWQSHNLSFFLAIRNYADFFSSSYATTVRRGLRLNFSAERRMELSKLPRRWTHVVSDVLDCFPNAILHVWRYEDFSVLREELVKAATGWNGAIVWQEAWSMKSLTHEEMEIALSSRLGEITPRQIRTLAASRYPEAHRKYDPWDEKLRLLLDERYREDCNQLSMVSGIQLHGSW
jgi:hypothetical protein